MRNERFKLSPFQLDVVLHSSLRRSNQSFFRYFPTNWGEIRYFDSGGDLPVLLTAPDGPCFLEHFEGFIRKSRLQHRVIVLDLPGFGESYPKNGYDHSFESAVSVIKSLVDHLDLRDLTLSLSCANGFYGIYFAKKHPERVKKLVLTQTPGFEGMRPWLKASVPAPIKIPYIGQLLVFARRIKIPGIWFRVALPKNSPHLAPWSRLAVEKIKDHCCNCLASVVQGLSGMREEDLKGCHVPTLMIWGARDYSHRFTDPYSIREVIPQAEVVIWDDCGHFPELEQTEKYLKLIS